MNIKPILSLTKDMDTALTMNLLINYHLFPPIKLIILDITMVLIMKFRGTLMIKAQIITTQDNQISILQKLAC